MGTSSQGTNSQLASAQSVAQGQQGTSASNTGTNQTQTTGPYAAAAGNVNSLLGSLAGLGTGLTGNQIAGVSQLQQNAAAIPQLGGQAYGTLSPYLQSNYTNPYTNPVLQSALQYANQGITNQINGQFAAAGRSLSPANTTALGYGLGSADAQMLLNQYNTNVNQQQNAVNQLQGLPGLYTAPGTAALGAANAGYNLPYANIGQNQNLVTPLAGLGSTTNLSGATTGLTNTSGTSNTGTTTNVLGSGSTTNNPSLLGMLGGLFGGGANSTAMGIGGLLGGLF